MSKDGNQKYVGENLLNFIEIRKDRREVCVALSK